MGLSAAAIGAIISAAGAGVGAASQVESARQQKKALETQATQREQDSLKEEAKFRRESARLKAEQKTKFLKGGVVTGEGTPLTVEEETAELAEMEALAIRTGGLQSAEARRTEATAVGRAGAAQGAGTFLSGLGQSAGSLKTGQ
jgi:hypothetical protein